MGTILASTVYAQVAELLEDDDNVTYLEAGFIRWFNEGQRAVVIVDPSAYSERDVLTLTAGSPVHTVADTDVRQVLEIYRNTNAGGTSHGRAIILCDRQTLDETDPDWGAATGSTSIQNWWLDERDPKTFWTYPPAHASTACYVDALLSKYPADIDATTDALTLDDIYQSAMVEWIMHRFTGRDSEDTPNWQRSQSHLQKFLTMVTGDAKNLRAMSAKLRDEIK